MSPLVDMIGSLPLDLIRHLSRYLSIKELGNCARVNKTWKNQFSDDKIWESYVNKLIIGGRVFFTRNINSNKMKLEEIFRVTFRYPPNRGKPFDEVVLKIIGSLRKKDWKVPGISILFNRISLLDEWTTKYVETIKTKDFTLLFNSEFQTCGNQSFYNDGSIESIQIGKKELKISSDIFKCCYNFHLSENLNTDQSNNRYKAFSSLKTPHSPSKNTISYQALDAQNLSATDRNSIPEFFITQDNPQILEKNNLMPFYKSQDIFDEFNKSLRDILNKIEANESFE